MGEKEVNNLQKKGGGGNKKEAPNQGSKIVPENAARKRRCGSGTDERIRNHPERRTSSHRSAGLKKELGERGRGGFPKNTEIQAGEKTAPERSGPKEFCKQTDETPTEKKDGSSGESDDWASRAQLVFILVSTAIDHKKTTKREKVEGREKKKRKRGGGGKEREVRLGKGGVKERLCNS